MNPGEHAIMAEVEEHHWWYRALRSAITTCLQTPRFALPHAPRILDAGCGTGGNLKALAELTKPSYLGGFDPSQEGLEAARRKVPAADLYQSSICDPEIHQNPLDLVLCADVIYITGAEEALPGLRRIMSALRPGGLFILNLPAYGWLFSEHDVAVHTKERYTAKSVSALLNKLDLRIELLTYRVCFLFPAAVAMRLPSLLRKRDESVVAKSELHSESKGFVNETLYGVTARESSLIARGMRLPFGTSVFAIARRV